jgi:hypothetical protein
MPVIMNRLIAFVVAVLLSLAAVAVIAQESVTITTPVAKTTTSQRVSYIGLDLDNRKIVVELKSNLGETTNKVYDETTTPTGASLLTTLNRSNNSTTSLVKRVYQRLQTDGAIPAGSITGTPQ